jgi:hypothetical protein
MKAVACRLWAVGQKARRSSRLYEPVVTVPAILWRAEFAAPTPYVRRLQTAAAFSSLATAYSLQPTGLRLSASRPEVMS